MRTLLLIAGGLMLLTGVAADAAFHLLPAASATQMAAVLGADGGRAHALTAAGSGVLLSVILWRVLVPDQTAG